MRNIRLFEPNSDEVLKFLELEKTLKHVDPVKKIALMSNYYGSMDVTIHGHQYIFLGGGNTSVNFGNVLYAKPSGKKLSVITAEEFVENNVEAVLTGLANLSGRCDAVMASDYTKDFSGITALDKLVKKLFGTSSVETGLHAQLKGSPDRPRYNLHDHNVIKNWLLCADDAETNSNLLFNDNPNVKFIEFIEPGAILSVMFNRRYKKWGSDPKVILMGQHGAVETGYSPREVFELDRMIIKRVLDHALPKLSEHPFNVSSYESPDANHVQKAIRYVSEVFKEDIIREDKVENPDEVTFMTKGRNENDYVLRMLNSKKALDTIARGMPNPDTMVYGKAAVMVVDYKPGDNIDTLKERIQKAKERYITDNPFNLDGSPYIPRIVLIPGLCAITMGGSQKVAENAYPALLDTVYTMDGAEAFGGMISLSYKHKMLIANWSFEKYRQKIALENTAGR